MAKISKRQAKLHTQACDYLASDKPLTDDQKEFILENWNEAATSLNTDLGAHFTPLNMAMDVAFDVWGPKVLDLCAGIGALSLAAVWRGQVNESDITLIEFNPSYIEVGRRLLPEARWIEADVFTLPSLGLGRFDTVVSNPPFGRHVKISTPPPRYTGGEFDLAVIDLASDYCDRGVFIVPQRHAPFRYSGQQCFRRDETGPVGKLIEQTGLHLDVGIGVDTSIYRDAWKTTSVTCEVVVMSGD